MEYAEVNVNVRDIVCVCTAVFKSTTEEERKKRILETWIRMINYIEKNKRT